MSHTPGFFRRADDSGVPLLIARLIVGGVMILYAAPKIAEPGAFLKEIHNYRILPTNTPYFENWTAVILPWVEMLGGIALIAGLLRRGTATLFTLLLIVFTLAVTHRAVGLYNQSDLSFCQVNFDCGCGAGPIFICSKLAENFGLILLAAYAVLSRSNRFSVSALWQRRPSRSVAPTPAQT